MGNTLGELMSQFAQASDNEDAENPDKVHEQALEGHDKTASDGGTTMAQEGMGSLADLYLSMTEMDKTAEAAAGVPADGEPELTEDDIEKVAEAEAAEWQTKEEEEETAGEPDMMKVAAEYDAAGRIMARGFFDEYEKLAMGTSAADNQGTDAESAAATPAHGQRGLPTLDTNYAGQAAAGTKSKQQAIDTSGGKEVFKNVLKPGASGKAGNIVGDKPDVHARPHFANVTDIMDSNR